MDTHFEDEKIIWPFRFEAIWTKDETSREVVDRAWQLQVGGSQGFKLARKQTNTKNKLKKWNNEHFGNVRERIKELEKNIEEVQGVDPTKENLELEAALNLKLDDWLAKENLKWHKKSREILLKEVDRNSRFFHLTTLVRRRRNFISDIKQEDSSWILGREAIQEYFNANFQSLYQSSRPQIPENLENLIDTCVSVEENVELCRIPTREEVKKAIFRIKSLKSLGPDGLPALF